MSSVDEKQKNVMNTIILNYLPQIKTSIEEHLKTQIPQIDGQKILGYLKHQGAGGTTYILQSQFSAGTRRIQGGIVVKFCNELSEDVRNAQDLEKILKLRNQEWEKSPPSKPLPDWIPNIVFAPKVLGTHPSNKVMILEFIGGGIPLQKSNFPNDQLYQILGYSLGRLHGTNAYSIAMELYEPMFKLLEVYFPNSLATLDFWKNIISNSKGGCQFIHGDSHLENLMYSTTTNALAWIDALLVPRGDRMDDVTYGISYIVQEEVIAMLKANPAESTKNILSTCLREVARKIVPLVLTTYMRTANLKGLYVSVIPVDFFLGAHLIIRSQMFGTSKVSDILATMGREFILERPLGKLLGLEK
ncbi:MAG: hypothetical protein ACXAC7_02855 [Candidatus Hodarchaeales archaeon]